MLAWPSISCTARRSPLDSSTWLANECRSMCGCTGTSIPCCFALHRSRACTARPPRRRPLRVTNTAGSSAPANCVRTANQGRKASRALVPPRPDPPARGIARDGLLAQQITVKSAQCRKRALDALAGKSPLVQRRHPSADFGGSQTLPVGDADAITIGHAPGKIASVMGQRERRQAPLITEMAEKSVEMLPGTLVHPWRAMELPAMTGEAVRQHFAQPREVDRAHAGMEAVGILRSKAQHAVGIFFSQRNQRR